MPGTVGAVSSGLFFGFAFGLGGNRRCGGARRLADRHGIELSNRVCAYLVALMWRPPPRSYPILNIAAMPPQLALALGQLRHDQKSSSINVLLEPNCLPITRVPTLSSPARLPQADSFPSWNFFSWSFSPAWLRTALVLNRGGVRNSVF